MRARRRGRKYDRQGKASKETEHGLTSSGGRLKCFCYTDRAVGRERTCHAIARGEQGDTSGREVYPHARTGAARGCGAAHAWGCEFGKHLEACV